MVVWACPKTDESVEEDSFYRHWAYETEQLLGNEQRVNAHPVYGLLRKLRFKENYLFSFAEIEKMVGLLFMRTIKIVWLSIISLDNYF